jgi:hypothetical protein
MGRPSGGLAAPATGRRKQDFRKTRDFNLYSLQLVTGGLAASFSQPY